MKYAVIRTGGKQYKIQEGDIIDIERLSNSEKSSITFSEVLMANTDGQVQLGSPLLNGVTIKASIVENFRGEKIRVAKYKAKVRYRRVTGHRQALTRVKIDSIVISGSKKAEKSEKSAPVDTKKAPVKTS